MVSTAYFHDLKKDWGEKKCCAETCVNLALNKATKQINITHCDLNLTY